MSNILVLTRLMLLLIMEAWPPPSLALRDRRGLQTKRVSHNVTENLVNPSTRTAPCFRLPQFLTQCQMLTSSNQSSSLIAGSLSQVRKLKGFDEGCRKGPMDG